MGAGGYQQHAAIGHIFGKAGNAELLRPLFGALAVINALHFT